MIPQDFSPLWGKAGGYLALKQLNIGHNLDPPTLFDRFTQGEAYVLTNVSSRSVLCLFFLEVLTRDLLVRSTL